MALDKGLPQGRTVGDIYAWGAAGSIAGTFAAGFYLIAAMGTIPIIWTVGGILILLAILYRQHFWPFYLWMAVFVIIALLGTSSNRSFKTAAATLLLRSQPDPQVLYEDESQYCYIAVKQKQDNPNIREFMQDKLVHSTILMGDINDLQYFYTKIYTCITREMSKNKRLLNAMIIGGGGYVYPRYLEANWPGSRIDVVEIDPRVTKAAIAAFGLDPNSSIKTISMDARNYVEGLLEKQRNGGQTPKYDFIYEDAINDYSVPYQLVTLEFNNKIARILADDGAYMVNLIDTYDSALFLGAVVSTLQQTFPHVYVATNEDTYPLVRETFVVVATKYPLDINAIGDKQGLKLWNLNESEMQTLRQKAGKIVLTDNYAPVENVLAPVARQDAKEMLARKYLRQAQELQSQQKWEQSIEMYKKALTLNPTTAIKVYNEIGMMQAAQNNLLQAIETFQKAVDYHKHPGGKKNAIGSIYLNLGMLLNRVGRHDEARQQLTLAVEEFRLELKENPNSPLIWSRMGDSLATMGDFKAASDAFGKAVVLDPGNIENLYNLAKTLEFQGRFSESIAAAQKAAILASGSNQQQLSAGLNEYLRSLEQKKSQQGQ